jgi:hypothetical protein
MNHITTVTILFLEISSLTNKNLLESSAPLFLLSQRNHWPVTVFLHDSKINKIPSNEDSSYDVRSKEDRDPRDTITRYKLNAPNAQEANKDT